ncbi:MAG: hypothetical protein AAF216_10890 [Pseudomonadota bacterium]
MKKLMIGAAAIALLTACGESADEAVEETVVDVAEAGELAAASAEDAFAELGNIVLRRGNAASASEALAAMSLDTSGAGRLSFASSDTDDDGASFVDVEITVPDEDGSIMIGELVLDGLDMVDGQASFSKLSLNNIQMVPGDEAAADDGTLNVGNIELLNPSPELASWVASLMGEGEPADFPEGDAVSFDKWSLSDLNFAMDDGADTADFNIASIELGNVAEQTMAVARISDISLTGSSEGEGPFTMSLGSMTTTGADLAFLDVVRENFDDEDELASALMELSSENPVDPGYDSFSLDTFNLNFDGVAVDVPSLDINITRNDDGVPIANRTLPFTMSLSADADAGEAGSELAGALGMVGYETVEISGEGQSAYDPDTDKLSFDTDNNYLTVADGFTMQFGGEVEGYSALSGLDFAAMADGGEPDADLMEEALSELILHDFTLVLDDDSMVDRVFNLVAAQTGDDPSALRQQAVAMTSMAPMMAAGSGVDVNILTEASGAIAEFLQTPGTLTISLNPSEPISAATFADMEDPSAITKDFLGLSITHE